MNDARHASRPVLIYAIVPEGVVGGTVHTVGPLPEPPDWELVEGGVRMPPARVLLGQESHGQLFLLRYAEDGEFAGDTFHASLADLKEAAQSEFGRPFEWREVPPDVADAVAFALSQLHD